MNTKIIHITVLFLLISLTAHEVHAVVVHDAETCDVCIHIQSNNDALVDNPPQYIVLDLAFHLKFKAQITRFQSTLNSTADLIRGPPSFS
jgi:hypothetical protein